MICEVSAMLCEAQCFTMVLQCCDEENCDCKMSTDWRYGLQGKALVIQRRRQEPTTSGSVAPSINDLPQDGYLSDTVCNALVAKIEENPVYVTSVFVENSPLPATTYEDVQDAEISQILKTVLSYYQSGENARVSDEKAIGNIKQEISLNENLLYDKALNDSLSETDYGIIFEHFASKSDINSKIMACNILTSSENYDDARQQASAIRSLGTAEAINCADVYDMYINTMDTIMTKGMLKQYRTQLENYISDNNYLYSGIATSLYEYAFDTILPEYTPLFEDEITSKSIRNDNKIEMTSFIVYPNPTDGYITISIDKEKFTDEIIEFINKYGSHVLDKCEDIIINIYNTKSQLVGSYFFKDKDNMNINIRNYVAGTYVMEIVGCYGNVYQTNIIKL